jgi:hypothetical protein
MEYPLCRKCGKSLGMGIENMKTGVIEPIDLCYECLWAGTTFNQMNDQIYVTEEWIQKIKDSNEVK